MNQVIVNVSLLIVEAEIDNILVTYPVEPYQKAFTRPDLKSDLLVYVLNRITGIYVTIPESEKYNIEPQKFMISSERMYEIECLIHQGIRNLVYKYTDKQISFRRTIEMVR